MQNFSKWLENNYKNSGVPWYSRDDLPSTRGPSDVADYGTERMRMTANKDKYNYLTGRRFIVKDDGYFVRPNLKGERKFPLGSKGTVIAVGGENISYKMDHEDRKRTYPVRNFLYHVELLEEGE